MTPTADSVCAACADLTWGVDAAADCVANPVCGSQVGGATRADGLATRVVAGTCADCTGTTYGANGAADCLANTVCGAAVPENAALRTSADASRTVAGTCAACADGSWGTATGACELCTAIANKATAATLTCTTAANSVLVGVCAADYYEVNQASVAEADSCAAVTTSITCGKAVPNAAGLRADSAAT